MAALLLYTRVGCCLCEGLEERLRALQPPLALRTQDVDADPALAARYGLEVPLLAVDTAEAEPEAETGAEPEAGTGAKRAGPRWRLLPRVPPRLEAERLRDWLRRQGVD